MRLSQFSFLIIFSFISLTLQAIPSEKELPIIDFDKMDEYVETQMKEANIPGASLAVIEGNQIVHSKGYGTANPNGQLMTPDTPVILGSLTKSFTAVAIMQLKEQGKIDLDAPANQYIPWFRLADEKESNKITISELLHQISGISTRSGERNFANPDTSSTALEDAVKSLRNYNLIGPVAGQFEYSNSNYNTLGAIVQAVSGLSYEEYIQQHIFQPLEMKNSFTSQSSAENELAIGSRYWYGIPVPAFELPFARSDISSAFLISSANDLANYLIAHLNEGVYKDIHLVSKVSMKEIHTPETGFSLEYAMGWFVQEIEVNENNKVKELYHIGTVPSFDNYFVLYPEYDRAFVMLVTAGSSISGPNVIELKMNTAQMLLGMDPPPIAKAPTISTLILILIIILLIQIIYLFFKIRKYMSYRNNTKPIQATIGYLTIQFIIPLLFGLLIAWFMLSFFPKIQHSYIPVMVLFSPDFGGLISANGIVALVLCITLIVGMSWILRRNKSTIPQSEDDDESEATT